MDAMTIAGLDIAKDHIAVSGFGAGGLEAMLAGPTIVEDNCFIGARHGRLLGQKHKNRQPGDGRSQLCGDTGELGGGNGETARQARTERRA